MMPDPEGDADPPKLLQSWQRKITLSLQRIPVTELGDEVLVQTPFETPNFEAINLHVRRYGDGLELADGGTLASHFEASRASLETPPLGLERLLRFYDCSLRNGELVKPTDSSGLVPDALEFMMAVAALGGLTSSLASKSSNPFPSDVRNQLKERGYGIGPGRIEVADFVVRYDVNYEPRNLAMQCVGGSETRVANPDREIRKAIDRMLEVKKFTSKDALLVLDPDNDWWHRYEPVLAKVADQQVMNGNPLYDLLGEPS